MIREITIKLKGEMVMKAKDQIDVEIETNPSAAENPFTLEEARVI